MNANETVTATFNTNDSTNPTAKMTLPSKTLQFVKPISLGWSGTDAGSGIKDFTVQMQKANFNGGFGSFSNIAALTHVTGNTGTFNGAFGFAYCFRVQSRDNALNTSAFSAKKCTQVPVDDPQMAAAGTWQRKTGQPTPSKTLSVSSAHNATLKLQNVKAKQIGIIYRTCSGCGEVQVLFGTTSLGFLNTDQAAGNFFTMAPAFSTVKTGTVTFKVATTGKKVQIDGLVVNNLGTVTTLAGRARPGQQLR